MSLHEEPLEVTLSPVHHTEVVPDELTPRVGAGVGKESAAHHRLGGLVGRHGELALLGDLAVVRTGVDAVHDKVRSSLIMCIKNMCYQYQTRKK